jgi:hypothetical protein
VPSRRDPALTCENHAKLSEADSRGMKPFKLIDLIPVFCDVCGERTHTSPSTHPLHIAQRRKRLERSNRTD